MRRVLCLLSVVALLAMSALPVAAQTTIDFKSIVHEDFERRASAEPCIFDEAAETLTCPGTGTVQGFGQVTSSIVFFVDAPPVRTLTFSDGSTLVLADDEFISFETPGNSTDAPGALVSFGNPFFFRGTWVVVGGTGLFEGATGEGTQIVQAAGDVINIKIVGTITLE